MADSGPDLATPAGRRIARHQHDRNIRQRHRQRGWRHAYRRWATFWTNFNYTMLFLLFLGCRGVVYSIDAPQSSAYLLVVPLQLLVLFWMSIGKAILLH
jgi:hypothetical protein